MSPNPLASRRKKGSNQNGSSPSAAVVSPVFVRTPIPPSRHHHHQLHHDANHHHHNNNNGSLYAKQDRTTTTPTTANGGSRSTASYSFLLGGQQRTSTTTNGSGGRGGFRRIGNKKFMSTSWYRFWQRNVLNRASVAANACSSSSSLTTMSAPRVWSSPNLHQRRRRQRLQAVRIMAFLLLMGTGAVFLIHYVFSSLQLSSSPSSTSRTGPLRRSSSSISSSSSSAGHFNFVDPLLRHRLEQQEHDNKVPAGTGLTQDLARERHELMQHGDAGLRFSALLRHWIRTIDDSNDTKMKKKTPVFQTHFSFDVQLQKNSKKNSNSKNKNQRQQSIPLPGHDSSTEQVDEEATALERAKQDKRRQQLEGQFNAKNQPNPDSAIEEANDTASALEERKKERLRQQLEEEQLRSQKQAQQQSHANRDATSDNSDEGVTANEQRQQQDKLRQQLLGHFKGPNQASQIEHQVEATEKEKLATDLERRTQKDGLPKQLEEQWKNQKNPQRQQQRQEKAANDNNEINNEEMDELELKQKQAKLRQQLEEHIVVPTQLQKVPSDREMSSDEKARTEEGDQFQPRQARDNSEAANGAQETDEAIEQKMKQDKLRQLLVESFVHPKSAASLNLTGTNDSNSVTSGNVMNGDKTVKGEKGREGHEHVGDTASEQSKTLGHRRLRTLADMEHRRDNNEAAAMYPSQCPTTPAGVIEITLIVQSSFDRAWILEETCRRWSDPIVAVVVLTQAQSRLDDTQYLQALNLTCPQMRVVTHILPKRNDQEGTQIPESETENDANYYPVNHLRNLGLDVVRTSHVLMADVDFVPSQDLPHQIRQALSLRQAIREAQEQSSQDQKHNREALIVPAFERTCDAKNKKEQEDCYLRLRHDKSFLPHSFEELRNCVLNSTNSRSGGVDGQISCGVFQGRENWEGHHSTHSSQWLAKQWYTKTRPVELLNGTTVHDIVQLDCFDSLRYEPYVAIPWCPMNHTINTFDRAKTVEDQSSTSVSKTKSSSSSSSSSSSTIMAVQPLSPYYDERFHGYGKNKIEYIQHLRFLQYRFAIVPQGFLIHNPHAESKAKQEWNGHQQQQQTKKTGVHSSLHHDMDQLYPQFLTELVRLYVSTKNSSSAFSWFEDYPGVVGLCPKTKEILRQRAAAAAQDT